MDLRSIVPWDELDAFRQRGLNPQHPMMRGLGQDPQVYYQSAVSANQCAAISKGIRPSKGIESLGSKL